MEKLPRVIHLTVLICVTRGPLGKESQVNLHSQPLLLRDLLVTSATAAGAFVFGAALLNHSTSARDDVSSRTNKQCM